jgi:hypothetical protein
MHHRVGHYAFIGGILIAIIAALLQTTSTFFSFTLLLLGIVVGFLNIPAKEVTPFLVAVIALLVAGNADFQVLNVLFSPLGSVLNSVFAFIKIFAAPAGVIAAIKLIAVLAKA